MEVGVFFRDHGVITTIRQNQTKIFNEKYGMQRVVTNLSFSFCIKRSMIVDATFYDGM
jgi:hypothetical protein